jgi:hypothetical protein
MAFGSVTLIAHTAVRSKSFKLWRASRNQPLGSDDLVTVGQIGNLQAKPKWLEFNLANPQRRDRVISEVVELIRTIALPYFERFSNPREVIAGLISGTMPWWWEPGALEYVACFGTPSQARELLMRYIQMRPDRARNFESGSTSIGNKASLRHSIRERLVGWLKRPLSLGWSPLNDICRPMPGSHFPGVVRQLSTVFNVLRQSKTTFDNFWQSSAVGDGVQAAKSR